MVAIFSPAFLNSQAYYFLVGDICELRNQLHRDCIIVPVIWKKCELTNHNFLYVSKIPYTRNGITNFYGRLLCKTLGAKQELLSEEIKKYHFLDEDDTTTKDEEKKDVDLQNTKQVEVHQDKDYISNLMYADSSFFLNILFATSISPCET